MINVNRYDIVPIVLVTTLAISLFAVFVNAIAFAAEEEQKDDDNKTKQILIANNIKNTSDFGWSSEGAHEEFYSVLKMFDNKSTPVDENGWSRAKHSGFTVTLDKPLDVPICSVAFDFYKPVPTTKYTLTIGGLTTSGNTDATTKVISLGNTCAKDVGSFSVDFAADDASWTTINEMRLYSKVIIPPIDPPVCGPNEVYDPIQKKCIPTTPGPGGGGNGTITNSTFTFNIENSKIILNALNSTIITPPTGNGTTPPPGCTPDSYWNGTHCVPIGPPPPPPPNQTDTDVTALVTNTSKGFVVKGFGDLFELPESFFELNETETETPIENNAVIPVDKTTSQLEKPNPTIPDGQPPDWYKPGQNDDNEDEDEDDDNDEDENDNNQEDEEVKIK